MAAVAILPVTRSWRMVILIRNLPEFSPEVPTTLQRSMTVCSSAMHEREEDETTSCGTGVTAVALTPSRWSSAADVRAREAQMTPGGNSIRRVRPFGDAVFQNVWLTGPACGFSEEPYR